MASSRKRKATEPIVDESKQSQSTAPVSAPTLLPPPHPTSGWSGLPAALFQHVCSYLTLPVYDTLLRMLSVCRQWSHTLNSGDSTGFDCWRSVPTLNLRPHHDCLVIHGNRTVPLSAAQTSLYSLRRVHAVNFSFVDCPADKYSFFLDPLTSARSRVSLQRLCIDMRDELQSPFYSHLQKSNIELLSASLSHYLLHCPPLRSFELYPERGQWRPIVPSSAALRRLCSGPLVHLELEGAALAAMVWADRVEPTRPWKAKTLQSLVLHSPHIVEPSMALLALCLGLPSLTHLHLTEYHTASAVRYAIRPMGSRLTFLRLTSMIPSQLFAEQCGALQSLYLKVGSQAQNSIERVQDCLPLLPQLSELTLVEGRGVRSERAVDCVLMLPPLPRLTYLQLRFTMLVVALHFAPDPANSSATLPPSLACLSVKLHAVPLDHLLSTMTGDCAQLTHCHISCTDDGEARVPWTQRLQVLQSKIDIGVWCGEVEVEAQRLDRRWQRSMGLHLSEY